METLVQFFILFLVGAAVGFINTIGGGGSSLLYPVLMLMGFSPHEAVGTSRPAFLTQGISGILGFKSKGIFHYPINLYLGLSAFTGSILGAMISLKISPDSYKKIILLVILLVTLGGFLFNKKPKNRSNPDDIKLIPVLFVFFFLGVYSGFIQTGLGFLILFTMQSLLKSDIHYANSIKAMVVFMAGIPALVIFARAGYVHWLESFVIALGTGIGSWFTSRWSVDINRKSVQKIIVTIILILIIKLSLELN